MEPTEGPAALEYENDFTVFVPAGRSNAAVLLFLDRAGDYLGASRAGLRFRLSIATVQQLFDEGITGPEMVQFLADHSGAAVPSDLVASLDSWWSRYGMVRLYDDVTIVELADDYVLPELLATSSLSLSIVSTLSPRHIVVETGVVDDLVAELTRLGHIPKVVEGA
jgi:hypothetical protein